MTSIGKSRKSFILEDKPTPGNNNDVIDSDELSSSESSFEPGAIHLASTPRHDRYNTPYEPSDKRESMRSKAIQRSLSKHITMSNLKITKRSLSAISTTDHGDIYAINTNFADEIRVCCGCCNIYNCLYFISFYHLFMSIPLLCLGFILFDIAAITESDTEHIHTLHIMDNLNMSPLQREMIIFGIYVSFGLLRFITFALGMYLIPKFKYENLAMLHERLYRYYKRLVKIWLGLLLLSPLLYDVLLLIEYIDDVEIKSQGDEYTVENEHEIIFVFTVFVLELLTSIYSFFTIHGFIAIKWPNK